jgi:hypothetical protein
VLEAPHLGGFAQLGFKTVIGQEGGVT